MPGIAPSLVLAVLLGVFWAAGAVFIRATGAARFIFVLLASVTGAWAGDWLGGRIGGVLDVGRIGDCRPIPSSVGALVGISLVVVVAILAPAPGDENLDIDDASEPEAQG
jgi:hypothetical protein